LRIINLKLDPSALKQSGCDRRFQLSIMRGHTSSITAEPLTMGTAIHKYAHQRARGDDLELAMTTAIDWYLEHLGVDSTLLISAISTYNPSLFLPLINLGHLEMYYEFLYRSYEFDDTKLNIYLCGTIDRLGINQETQQVVAYDYKSTRKYKLSEVVNDYRYTVQFMFYYWILRRHHDKVPQLFNVGELCDSATNVFVQPVPILLSAKPPTWNRGPLLQFETHLDEFEHMVGLQCDSIAQLYQLYQSQGLLAPPVGTMSDLCTRCEYAPACHSQIEGKFDDMIESLFTTRVYDPSKFGK